MPGGALLPLKHNHNVERRQERRERRQQDLAKIMSTIEHGTANIHVSREERETRQGRVSITKSKIDEGCVSPPECKSRQAHISTLKRETDRYHVGDQSMDQAFHLSKNNKARFKQREARVA